MPKKDEVVDDDYRLKAIEEYLNSLAFNHPEFGSFPPELEGGKIYYGMEDVEDVGVPNEGKIITESDRPVEFKGLEGEYRQESLPGGLTLFSFRTNATSDGTPETTHAFRSIIVEQGKRLHNAGLTQSRRSGNFVVKKVGSLPNNPVYDRLCVCTYRPPEKTAFFTMFWTRSTGPEGVGALSWRNSEGLGGVKPAWTPGLSFTKGNVKYAHCACEDLDDDPWYGIEYGLREE